ncbi:PHD-type domain-containing protein [Aphelenchoides bicaudatus]|nr:PHD-type domain-containing protein [Aphelenchoides bicaudatus]
MDSARAMVSDYARSGSGSGSSTSSTKYTQKRQRLEQITHSLEEPARTRNSVSSSRSSNQRSSNNKQSSSGNSRSNKRQPSSSSQSRAKDEKPNAVKTRSKNAEEEEQSNAKPDSQQHCIVCKRGVRNTRDLRHCQKCKKCSHATCNSGFVLLDTQNAYLCSDCAKKEKLASPTHSSNNNTTLPAESNPVEEEEFAVVSDEETNRPSCSQSVQTSEDELTSTANQQSENAKNAPATGPQDNSIASNVQARKRNRRTRTRSSPQQQTAIIAVRSNSSASEEQSSPVGSKLLKTRISGSPSSSSIGISMTTAEPSNDAPSEVSLSPESVPEVAKISEESQAAKPTSQRSRKGEGNGKRSRGPGQKKPTSTNRTGPTMRTRFAGQPTPNIAQVSTIYSMYERTGKTNRGRKSGKGKGGSRGGRRGKVLPTINKSRSRQVQSTSGFGQNSIDNGDAQDRLRSHDENDYVRTPIVTCCTNKFMDSVPLCIICGSVGQDTEAANADMCKLCPKLSYLLHQFPAK